MDFNKVKALIELGASKYVKKTREYSDTLRVHSVGDGVDRFLSHINNYENTDQHTLRKKFAISNVHVIDNLLRAVQNVWTARGGSLYTTLRDSQKDIFSDVLGKVYKGKNLKTYIQTEHFDSLIDDPNGFSYLYFDDDKLQIEQLPSSAVMNYESWSDGVKWILFEPEVNEIGEETFLFIDSEQYLWIKRGNGTFTVLEESGPNPYGFVPVVFNAEKTGVPNVRKFSDRMRISPINGSIQLLESYLRKNSVKEIYEFLHAYPKFWTYALPCPVCDGMGIINDDKDHVCGSCGGSGTKSTGDVSEVIRLTFPEGDETKVTPDVAGYIQPDLATLGEMRTELKDKWESLYQVEWGTQYEKASNETATGRFIDVQPVNNRLAEYSEEIEIIHNRILSIALRMTFPLSADTYAVMYGNQFIIETSDQALKAYNDSKDSPETVRNDLLNQFILSEYKNDEIRAEHRFKEVKIEPFVHHSFEEIDKLSIPQRDKIAKYYYNEWLMTLAEEHLNKSVESLRDSFNQYVELKIKENGLEQNEGGQPKGSVEVEQD